MSAPYSSELINLIDSQVQPNVVHSRNSFLFRMYVRYLLQKLISVFDFRLPEDWAQNYFAYVLMGYGFISVFDTDRYGVVCQQCSLGDNVTLYYQPQLALVANPVFKRSLELKIGVNCELIKLQPDYGSPLDIVSTYADLMTLAMETAGINLLNSKTSYVFFADNPRTAESYKKAYDQIASGNPMTVIDKSMLNENGDPAWRFFEQNVGQNYITDRLLNDLRTIENEFNTLIGIPNANTQKRERLISDEVLSNRADTSALVTLWLDTMRKDMERVNQLYGLDLGVSYRYESEVRTNE